MSNPVKGIIGHTQILDTRGAYTQLAQLRSGWYNLTAYDTGFHLMQTDEDNFDRTTEGRYCPRDETISLFVSADLPGFVYYLPAGGTIYLEHVRPRNPYGKDGG